jgi:hypothetical protein
MRATQQAPGQSRGLCFHKEKFLTDGVYAMHQESITRPLIPCRTPPRKDQAGGRDKEQIV